MGFFSFYTDNKLSEIKISTWCKGKIINLDGSNIPTNNYQSQKVPILYILVSDESDYYYEQALISITSARIFDNVYVFLLVDDKTKKNLCKKRSEILNLVDEVIVEKFPADVTNKIRSRWLKTSMVNYLNDNFIFLDVDTIVSRPISGKYGFNENVCAVLDRHGQYRFADSSFWHYLEKIEKILKGDNFFRRKTYISNKYFNSGVLLINYNRQTKGFFKTWHEVWLSHLKLGLVIDQPALAKANDLHNNFIAEISGVWNCQVVNGINFLSDAIILHFFATNFALCSKPHFFMNYSTYQLIRDLGYVDACMLENIKNAKSLFSVPAEVICGEEVLLRYSKIYRLLVNFWYKLPRSFSALQKILAWLSRVNNT